MTRNENHRGMGVFLLTDDCLKLKPLTFYFSAKKYIQLEHIICLYNPEKNYVVPFLTMFFFINYNSQQFKSI